MFDVALNVPLQLQMGAAETYGSMKQNEQHCVKSVRITDQKISKYGHVLRSVIE